MNQVSDWWAEDPTGEVKIFLSTSPFKALLFIFDEI